ncbi:MAG: NAD(P)H-dependent oxidoreductase subunit E [Candidatus Accumulibacter sp.]|nr:NAD(P)H-dependent oxidoreductase subunit E [Accumulibacter sp.]
MHKIPDGGAQAADAEAPAERNRRRNLAKGRQADAAACAEVRRCLGDPGPAGYRRDLLIEFLHRLQDAHGALRERHLVALAQAMKLPMAEVYEVASFYHHFDIVADNEPPPGLTLRVCTGLSCSLAGAGDLLAATQRQLEGAGLRLLAAPCIGRCEQAPAALLGQHAVPQATPAALLQEISRQATGSSSPTASRSLPRAVAAFDPAALAGRAVTPVPGQDPTRVPYADYATYRATGGYALAAALASGALPAARVLQAMNDSGLRGLGGAGFPAGRKWQLVRDEPAPRLLAVNIDEGEPGTFKDRTWLERDPHRFLEGVLIAAQVVGIAAVYVYVRDEYHEARALLASALADLVAAGPCPLPAIELRRGAGAYICGEESAMIESIEGRRGEPRLRPPYVAQRGLFGAPTLAHNFETLYWVRDIVERGPAWFAGFGRHGRHGLRSFSVSGRVRQPGVKLAPAGITLRELVDEYCGGMADGHTLYAYLPGGAAGGILPARLADLPLDFDTLQASGSFIGSAGVIVLSQHDRARDAALAMMRFFAAESCGQCTPCRVGTARAAALMAAADWEHALLDDLAQVMADASICGLGQAAPNVLRSVQTHFPGEVAADRR